MNLGQDQMLPVLPPLISVSRPAGSSQPPPYNQIQQTLNTNTSREGSMERRDNDTNYLSDHEIHLAALQGEKSSAMKKLVSHLVNQVQGRRHM